MLGIPESPPTHPSEINFIYCSSVYIIRMQCPLSTAKYIYIYIYIYNEIIIIIIIINYAQKHDLDCLHKKNTMKPFITLVTARAACVDFWLLCCVVRGIRQVQKRSLTITLSSSLFSSSKSTCGKGMILSLVKHLS